MLPAGGPLAEQGGLFWVAVPGTSLERALLRLPRLGYMRAVDLVEPADDPPAGGDLVPPPDERLTRWRRGWYRLVRVYEENAEAAREQAVDRRPFLFETAARELREVTGYRGDGRPLSRRGLPVYDARLLVNLVFRPGGGVLLDPFAGTGGIVLEALAGGWHALSVDVDPRLRYGLSALDGRHCVGDARALPFPTGSCDAIATEPPYDRQAETTVVQALREMHRVLRGGGRVALLCAAWQAEPLRREATALGLVPYLDSPVNRKGLDVVVLAWQKAGECPTDQR